MSINVCTVCTCDFIRKRHTTGLYCSRRCAWVARGGSEFNARIAKEHSGKRGDSLRGRGLGKGYRKLLGRHEHRIVAEQTLGRLLVRGEIVHHIDGNRLNNDPSNLRVMTQREHMVEHGLGIKGMPRLQRSLK